MKKRNLIHYSVGQQPKFKKHFIDSLLKHTYISLADTRLRDTEVADLVPYFHQRGYFFFGTSIPGKDYTKKSEVAVLIRQSAVDKVYNIHKHRQKGQGRAIAVSFSDSNFNQKMLLITVYIDTKNKLDSLLSLIRFINNVAYAEKTHNIIIQGDFNIFIDSPNHKTAATLRTFIDSLNLVDMYRHNYNDKTKYPGYSYLGRKDSNPSRIDLIFMSKKLVNIMMPKAEILPGILFNSDHSAITVTNNGSKSNINSRSFQNM